jgi:2-amino-4-hydroxy-6-hydroxymethyldihydropteridine diphosphokinase
VIASPRTELVAFGLGANLADPRHQLLVAVRALSARLGALAVAPLYRTAPLSPVAQPDYLNTVVLLRSALAPRALLACAQELEQQAGRARAERWGPRTLDVDLLFCGDRTVDEPDLTLPHPRLRERAFVLAPLAALVPELPLSPDGRTPRALLAALGEAQRVERVPWSGPPDGG